jgi:hypothetical protein
MAIRAGSVTDNCQKHTNIFQYRFEVLCINDQQAFKCLASAVTSAYAVNYGNQITSASMKFVLDPDNRNCADSVLLDDLRQVAGSLDKESVTKDEYNKHGRFSAATMQKRFGSWNVALQQSGVVVAKRVAIPRDELLSDLNRVAGKLGTQVLSIAAYEPLGRFSAATLQRTFGSWPIALAAAGLKISESWRPKAQDEELLSNLAKVWESLGRQPKKSDMIPPLSRISAHSYVRRFGSWREALESFVNAANLDVSEESHAPLVSVPAKSSQAAKKATQRNPSWQLRFLVNRRDRFTCCACGRSPATHIGVVLHVDHIVPWSKGGETVLANLQTLCEVCNIGKGSLPMHESHP